jgi:hypothetical protein
MEAGPPRSRRRVLSILLAAVVLVVIAGIAYSLLRGEKLRTRTGLPLYYGASVTSAGGVEENLSGQGAKVTEVRCDVYPENFVSWIMENGNPWTFYRYPSPLVGVLNYRAATGTLTTFKFPMRLWTKLYIGDIDWQTLENAYLTFENIYYGYRRNTILGPPDVNLYTFDIYAVDIDSLPVGTPDDKTWNFHTDTSKIIGTISTEWKPEHIVAYSTATYSGVKQVIDNRYITYDTPNAPRELLNAGGDNLIAGLRPVYYVALSTLYCGPITVKLIDNYLDWRTTYTFEIPGGTLPYWGDTYTNKNSFCYFWRRTDENSTLIYIEFVVSPERPVQVSIKCPDNNVVFYFEKGYSSYSNVSWSGRGSTTINITPAVYSALLENKNYLYLAIKARDDGNSWQTLNSLYPRWSDMGLTYIVPYYYNYIYPVYYSGTSVKFSVNWVTGVKLKLTIVDNQTNLSLENVPKTIVIRQDNTTIQTITTSDAYIEVDVAPNRSYYVDVQAENYVSITNMLVSIGTEDRAVTLVLTPAGGGIILQPQPKATLAVVVAMFIVVLVAVGIWHKRAG